MFLLRLHSYSQDAPQEDKPDRTHRNICDFNDIVVVSINTQINNNWLSTMS